MRYGTLPIVRATGGLADTVTTYDDTTGAGTGFVFHDLRPDSLADTIGWAVSTWYNHPAHIEQMRRRAMAEDHSWDRAAREYVQLYRAAYARRRGHAFPHVVTGEHREAADQRERRPPAVPASPSPHFDRLPPLPARHRAAGAQGPSR
jgi:hypothetical protein